MFCKSKKYFLLLLLFSSASLFPQQKNYTFSELRGIEDKSGNTHLFYRKYFYEGDQYNNTFENSVYHLDLSNNIDIVFLGAYGYYQFPYGSSTSITDYEFWDNDPAKYIYAQVDCGTDCVTSLYRFDKAVIDERMFFFSSVPKISISMQNDSLLYTSPSRMMAKSTDGGRHWFVIDSTFLDLLSISIFNDQEIFAADIKNRLERSTDGGLNFNVVDTTENSAYPLFPEFIYDKDSLHIYRTSSYYNDSGLVRYLSVSDNKGDSDSWAIKYSSRNNIFIGADTSISDTIYISDGNKILISTDFGNSFSDYKILDSAIVGIYKKPGADKIYAATKYNIYEITSSSIRTIKSLIVSVDQSRNEIPVYFKLLQNFPNPFNPSTMINYELPAAGFVTIKVYDVLGRETATLVNEEKFAGRHSVRFDGKDLSSGIYFYSITAGSFHQTKKMILLR